MSSNQMAVRALNLSKCYQIYASPGDRLKQFVVPRLLHGFGQPQRQYYRDFWALRDVSFDIEKGTTVGIIGRNGSGKSTLLQMICGTLTPTSGTVETEGRVAALLELGSGFNPDFTGRENIYLNAAIYGLTRDEINQKFDDIASFADIGEFIEQPVKSYSSGMYVRLAFAVAVNVNPELLIVDEALAVGDARFQAKCMKRIKTIQETGATILFVAHDVGAVRALCESVIWLDRGSVRMAGDVFPVTGSYMENLFDDHSKVANSNIEEGKTIDAQLDGVSNSDTTVTQTTTEVYDAKPASHWGSHVGSILHAGIFNPKGQRLNAVGWGEEIEIRVGFKVPLDANLQHLSVAFSIKNLKGSDLIVSTTHDRGSASIKESCGVYLTVFKFTNYLITGEYLLVAAIEDRSSNAIHYYEYLEGAHYFSSIADARFHGIFQPQIEQDTIATHE